VIHPFLSKRGQMLLHEEIALELNFGHEIEKTIRKHYSSMPDSDRESVLDDLCRRALSDKSELELYLGFARNQIPEQHPDYHLAKQIYLRNSQSGPCL